MKQFGRFIMALMIAMGALGMGGGVAHAEDYECRGTLGAVTIVGNLLVPDDATCTLNGTYVQGSIVVKSRATLEATEVTVTGGIQGEGPRNVVVRRSTIGNSVSIRKAEPGGTVELSGSQITGDVQLEDNRGSITINGNELSGSIQANKNTGGLEISGNQIGNGLQCQDNNPPPTGGGNIAKQKQGQCMFL
ncbi:MAG: Cytochrome C553 (soluble cytochrome f) [uncultured Chloroflexia bacterium]|uniref:Cytochrome C553 (Soluble cytochrome f) n=1 Tax=uncultured Chloroflexia bacterium TaxID=1672391 RepID=A0A6J4JKV2_9CHLR|nr:MAG: Cytochrome C553 (soluble cytochrome f) [uncultured Chloroflexia bacterium]